MTTRSQLVYKTVKIYIFLLQVSEFTNTHNAWLPYYPAHQRAQVHIIAITSLKQIYMVWHILASGVNSIICCRHLQESRFLKHKAMTTQAQTFNVGFLIPFCKTACKLYLSYVVQCRACIIIAFSKVPGKSKRNMYNWTACFIVVN